jgi:hypothetical protein
MSARADGNVPAKERTATMATQDAVERTVGAICAARILSIACSVVRNADAKHR